MLRGLIGVLLVLLPTLAPAQSARLPRVGVVANTIPLADLVNGTSPHPAPRALVDGLRSYGWIDGHTVRLVWRSAEGNLDRLPGLVDELISEKVDVLVAYGPGVEAAILKTETIPILMATSGVTGKLTVGGKVRIESLARPGSNVTGLTLSIGSELNAKRLEILRLAAPKAVRIGFLSHESSGNFGPHTRGAAEKLGMTLHAFGFGPRAEALEDAFAEMARRGVDAVIVAELPVTNLPATQAAIHLLAQSHRMVVLHEVLGAVETGGLLAYGHDINKLYRRAPHFIDRILRGTKPGDIPIEQPVDLELRVNLKAARAIGITLPRALLLQASKVVE